MNDDNQKPYGPTFISRWGSALIGASAIAYLILGAITLAKRALGL